MLRLVFLTSHFPRSGHAPSCSSLPLLLHGQFKFMLQLGLIISIAVSMKFIASMAIEWTNCEHQYWKKQFVWLVLDRVSYSFFFFFSFFMLCKIEPLFKLLYCVFSQKKFKFFLLSQYFSHANCNIRLSDKWKWILFCFFQDPGNKLCIKFHFRQFIPPTETEWNNKNHGNAHQTLTIRYVYPFNTMWYDKTWTGWDLMQTDSHKSLTFTSIKLALLLNRMENDVRW